MRFDDERSDGPELVLREAPTPVPPRRRDGGMLTGVLMLAGLAAAVALGFYGRGWWQPSSVTDAAHVSPAKAGGAAVPEGFGPVPALDVARATSDIGRLAGEEPLPAEGML